MKKLLFGVFTAITLLTAGVNTGTPVYAASPTDAAKAQVCQGVSGQTGATCGNGGADIAKIIKAVISILSIVAGIAAVIMIIISGLKYITSSGDAQAVGGAKRTLIYALVGLVVVALAQFIVRYVLINTK